MTRLLSFPGARWLLFALALQLPPSAVRAADSAALRDTRVVLISIDGFPAEQFWDPAASLPVLRGLAAEGAVARRMTVGNPTTTWSNHTTLITGVAATRHGVIYNGLLVRPVGGTPAINPRLLHSGHVRTPTLLDVAHAADLGTAAINWPTTKGSAAIDDNFADAPEGFETMTPRLREALLARRVIDADGKNFKSGSAPARDEIWLNAATLTIAAHQPRVLLLHLLNTDGTHHKYGAGSAASQSALTLADHYVGRVLRALDEAGVRERTAVFIVSDHGFFQPNKIVYPNALLRESGWLQAAHEQAVHDVKAYAISNGGTACVYVATPADRAAVRASLLGKPGIERVLTPEEFVPLGWPSPEGDPLAPDFVLVPAAGYAMSAGVMGDATSPLPEKGYVGYHGYLASLPAMDGIFIAAGAGIRRGVTIERVNNRDVAPTLARLLGLALTNAEGRPLEELLSSAEARRN